METREETSAFLRSKGFRITPQREKILDIFYALPEGEHLSAENLQNILRQENSDISLATSYRTLKLLATLGVLRELDFAEDHKHYELARTEAGIPHQHIICVECGDTEEFTSVEVFNAAVTIAEKANYRLIDAQLKLFGQCQACQTKEALVT
jgi:Fur family transcriptional regulator, ferric uptake regulator